MGGCSVNVATGLAKLGEEVSVYTTIGDDMTGRWIYAQLENIGVGLECLSTENNCKSDLSAIIVDRANEDRVIFSNQVANQKLVVTAEKINNPQWIFIGDLSGQWQKNLEVIVATAKERNILLAFNPRQKTIHEDVEKVKQTISASELLFVNKDEALEILASSEGDSLDEDETFLITELRKIGAKTVVLTDGKRGAWAGDESGIFHVEALLVDTVDTTGAGDAFASGFLAGYFKEKKLTEALKWAVANSSSCVTQYGGQAGLLSESEIADFIRKIEVVKLV